MPFYYKLRSAFINYVFLLAIVGGINNFLFYSYLFLKFLEKDYSNANKMGKSYFGPPSKTKQNAKKKTELLEPNVKILSNVNLKEKIDNYLQTITTPFFFECQENKIDESTLSESKNNVETPFNKYDKEKKQDHLKPKANILLEPDVKLNDNIDNDSQPLNKTLDLYEFQENDLEEKASKSPEYDKLEEKTYTPLKAVNFDCYPILTKIDTNLNTDHRDYEDNEDFSESRDTSSYVPETEIESEGGEEETIIPIFKTINVTCPESTLTKDEPSEKPHISNIETNNSIVALSHRKNIVWDRKNFCPICFVEVSHFARHLERNHADESRVKKILSFPKVSNERKTLWDSLRKEGNFHLFREEKKVVAVRRPTEAQALDFDDFVVCENCSGVYKKKFL
ncbi:uncharacterized protein LOC126888848 isoform X1 [Diabrotica virgifera virgifera]|uniref:C2H2-type domain-containing protein n=2 Tax=Diabrotica virgifera virgifera TaxID=50390 RepID=A0ABM5KSR2_DIAVI|nr:uncharacterized protein LOC126888848 isoform X1 [Diabrotica virgifera virgifera]